MICMNSIWKNNGIFLIILQLKCMLITALVQCPTYQTHFEKIIGYRPLTNSPVSAHYGAPFEEKIIFKSYYQVPSVINSKCLEICQNNYDCISYAINLNKSECTAYTTNDRRTDVFNLLFSDDLVEDSNVIYFVKVCLNIPSSCKTVLWPITRVPGTSLIGRGFYTVQKLVTRRECIEYCLHTKSFSCRSISFRVSHKNNAVRFGVTNPKQEEIGTCTLNQDDKNTDPEFFRVASHDEEYIENQCNFDAATGGFLDDLCSYEHYPNSTFIYAEDEYLGLNDKECLIKCYKETKYFCKGISYQRGSYSRDSRCYTHSEDVISLGPRALIAMPNSYYMKRVKCLNLTVKCTNEDLIITYQPKNFFQGRIYTEKHSEECGVSGAGSGTTVLSIPIGTPSKEQSCGIHRAFDYEFPNRTLIFTFVIIQNNPLVQMVGDRYIKIGCISNLNRTVNNMLPDFVALETSVEFNRHKDYDGVGSFVVDNKIDLPRVSAYVLDASTNAPIREAKIGQILKFVISMDTDYFNYDFRAINLTASSDTEELELIGSSGCPRNLAIFPQLQKEVGRTSRLIHTKFKAFKFSLSSKLRFSVKIQFCYKFCPVTDCGYNLRSHGRRKRDLSDGTLRNSTQSAEPTNDIEISITAKNKNENLEYSVVDSDFEAAGNGSSKPVLGIQQYFGEFRIQEDEEDVDIQEIDTKRSESDNIVSIPLDITFNVVEPEINGTDRLVIGQDDQVMVMGKSDRVLVAGYAAHDGAFCLDQSLLIAILVFWFIFQVLILVGCAILVRRYRKMKSLLEDDQGSYHNYQQSVDRHVRWADQNSDISCH